MKQTLFLWEFMWFSILEISYFNNMITLALFTVDTPPRMLNSHYRNYGTPGRTHHDSWQGVGLQACDKTWNMLKKCKISKKVLFMGFQKKCFHSHKKIFILFTPFVFHFSFRLLKITARWSKWWRIPHQMTHKISKYKNKNLSVFLVICESLRISCDFVQKTKTRKTGLFFLVCSNS